MGRDVFKKAGEKRNWISKIQGLFFGGPKSPLLHPSVSEADVDSVTVVCASPPCPPEIFPMKITDLPQK